MNDESAMNWKAFTIRLVEALRWPLALVALLFIFREPITRFLTAMLPGA